MRKSIWLMAAILALMGSSTFATEPPVGAPETPQVASAEPASLDELLSQLTPEPTPKYGVVNGPCTVSITCVTGYTINCSGQNVCYWKGDSTNPNNRGFVECDGSRLYCSVQAIVGG